MYLVFENMNIIFIKDMGAELSHRSNTRTLKGLVSVTDAVLKSNRFTVSG